MANSALGRSYPHPLIGKVVVIADGAFPAGADYHDPEVEAEVAGCRGRATVTDIGQEEEGFPFGTVEARGWWWDWRDLEIE